MKRETVNNAFVFCVLVALGVGTRWMSDALQPTVSNFTATGAIALFAGYFFASRLVAVLAPLCVLVISNFWLKPYELDGQFAAVCVAFFIPALIGNLLRLRLNVATIIGGSLSSSVLFYLVTNFAFLYKQTEHPHTFTGVVESYIVGIPFFGRTLAGDLFFTAAIFGVYWAIASLTALARQPELARIASE